MSQCILVLGTPRSGTSCVAGVLHHLGVPMGERLMRADDWNPAGYFQDLDFEEILFDAYDGWGFPAWDDPRPANYAECAASVAALARQKSETHRIWGTKSNRLAFFLDAFKAGAGDDVRIIRTFRPKAQSVASLRERSGRTAAWSAGIITRMGNAIDQVSLTHPPVLTVNFANLLSDPRTHVTRIANACGLPVLDEAVRWVDPSLRRFD